jgi:addiction module HigA family antidote
VFEYETPDFGTIVAFHPGRTLRQYLKSRNVESKVLSVAIGYTTRSINLILSETREITPSLALRLGKFFETKPQFWLKLQMNYNLMLTFQKEKHWIDIIVPLSDKMQTHNKNLLCKISDLDLSVRSRNCLRVGNITYVGELVQKTERELRSVPNLGRISLNEIKEVLAGMELQLSTRD